MIQFKERILQRVDSLKERIFEISDDIFHNPELGNEEFRSSKILADELAKNGFEVSIPIGSQKTAFKAVKRGKSKKPIIAFLAEYDALPGVGHGCGHNWIGTASTFAGIVVAECIGELYGQIQVFGTPAEENFGGKIILLEEGFFDDADIAMMVHPSNETKIYYRSLAANVIEVEFKGKAAHAAASPWLGVNALDALIQSFVAIDNLKKQLNPAFRIPGIIKYGGDRANIVPDHAIGAFSLRTETLAEMDVLKEKVANIFKGASLATGCSFTMVDTERVYAPMITNKILGKIFEKNFLELGGKIIKNPLKGVGSVDIGNLSQKFPCIHPSVSVVDDFNLPGHSVEFGLASISEKGKSELIRTIKTLALTALEIFLNPSVIDEMKEELKNTPK